MAQSPLDVNWSYDDRDPNHADRYRITVYEAGRAFDENPVVWEGIVPTPQIPPGILQPEVPYEIDVTPMWDENDTDGPQPESEPYFDAEGKLVYESAESVQRWIARLTGGQVRLR